MLLVAERLDVAVTIGTAPHVTPLNFVTLAAAHTLDDLGALVLVDEAVHTVEEFVLGHLDLCWLCDVDDRDAGFAQLVLDEFAVEVAASGAAFLMDKEDGPRPSWCARIVAQPIEIRILDGATARQRCKVAMVSWAGWRLPAM